MKIFVTVLNLMTIGFAVSMSLASSASAQAKLEMPDLSKGYTVCKVQGLHKDETGDQVDSRDPADYQIYGTSAAKIFKTDKFDVFVEISEDANSSNITFTVDSLVNGKTLASSVASMTRSNFSYYQNMVAKPVDHFQSGEREFIQIDCRHKQ